MREAFLVGFKDLYLYRNFYCSVSSEYNLNPFIRTQATSSSSFVNPLWKICSLVFDQEINAGHSVYNRL